MQLPNMTPREPDPERETLEQQVRGLHERLAFYEGFDLLIQDNVAHARELFRLAAREREAASTAMHQARPGDGRREEQLRGELESIASDLKELSRTVEALSGRVARALGETETQSGGANGSLPLPEPRGEQPVTVVVHGVPSARIALSLQRFVASLPRVVDVSAREFAGGVLRLEARVQERLEVEQFRMWAEPRRIEPLTIRPDVFEIALHEPAPIRAGS